ncbi:hypothetical protein CPC08DRAFT_119546 [Agrocybe pediades]|nr:hypothetical protein CPC08DRAFT_119546 [Agrocybe pediades]
MIDQQTALTCANRRDSPPAQCVGSLLLLYLVRIIIMICTVNRSKLARNDIAKKNRTHLNTANTFLPSQITNWNMAQSRQRQALDSTGQKPK